MARKEIEMDLILWRHAEAEDGGPDRGRSLTPRGQKQAKVVARWLAKRLPEGTKILVSPAVRAQQTAEALERPVVTDRRIDVGAAASAVLTAAGWPDGSGAVLVVGHQPTLGRAAALALTGTPADWSIKKGAVWWLKRRAREGEVEVVLRAVIGPDLA
jgi:phosphohistidine phosphatase